MTSTVIDAKNQMAAQIGETESKVRVATVDWTPYIQQGVLVDLHIGRYRAQVSVTLEDLGIQPATKEERDALERTISLGRRFVLPKEVVMRAQEIEGWSRQWLLKNSFRTFWGQFVHVSRYQAWRVRQLEIEQAYQDLAAQIEREYPQLMAQMRDDYASLGQQVWQRLLQARNAEILSLTSDTAMKDQWVTRFINNSLRSVPSAREIRQSFTMTYDVRYIPEQASVVADRVAAEQTIMEARERARMSAEAAMKADLQITEARQAAGGIQQFVEDVQGQLRGAIYESVVAALETLRSGNDGRMPRGTTVRIKNMIDMVRDLTFWNDPDLQRKCDELGDLCEVTAARRDSDAVERILQDLGAESRLALIELNRVPARSATSLGIPDKKEELIPLVRRTTTRRMRDLGEMEVSQVSELQVTRRARTLE